MGSTVRVKKKCCGDNPRCARCPVVWQRLADDGHAVAVARREWKPKGGAIRKKVFAAARARG